MLILFLIFLFSIPAIAQNPILKGYADPHLKVFNGRMYMSVGKDLSPSGRPFKMPYWEIYSSEDLLIWRKEIRINPEDTYMSKGTLNCWATDIAEKNGKYYFYFSNGGKETGVLVAESPDGPYKDVLNRPIIPQDYSVNHEYDPTIFKDDDGKQYIIFGLDGKLGKNRLYYQIAQLSDDMLSLSEKSRDLVAEDAKFGNGAVQDHQYFHKYRNLYYLSCGGIYVTSTNVYGPFKNRRTTGQNGHSSFCEYNGQWYHVYTEPRIPFTVDSRYRQISMTYLHYKDNGDMVSDSKFLRTNESDNYYFNGVGNYNAIWPEIEMEWFFKLSGKLIKRECPLGGFEIQNIQNGDNILFPNVYNMKENSIITFYVSSVNLNQAIIEVRDGNPSGSILGKCYVTSTGGLNSYKKISCKLTNKKGTNNLCFVFKGNDKELMRIDKFSLK